MGLVNLTEFAFSRGSAAAGPAGAGGGPGGTAQGAPAEPADLAAEPRSKEQRGAGFFTLGYWLCLRFGVGVRTCFPGDRSRADCFECFGEEIGGIRCDGGQSRRGQGRGW